MLYGRFATVGKPCFHAGALNEASADLEGELLEADIRKGYRRRNDVRYYRGLNN